MRKLIYFFSVVTLAACNSVPDELPGSDLIRWVENPENNFKKSVLVSDLEYIIQQRPIDYIIALEFQEEFPLEDKVSERRRELSGMQYFSLRIADKKGGDLLANNISSTEEYIYRNNFYAYTFRDYIRLCTDEDTTECGLYNFVSTNGLTPYVEFVFAFEEQPKLSGSYKILIDDRILAQQKIEFEFQNSKSPKIITQ